MKCRKFEIVDTPKFINVFIEEEKKESGESSLEKGLEAYTQWLLKNLNTIEEFHGTINRGTVVLYEFYQTYSFPVYKEDIEVLNFLGRYSDYRKGPIGHRKAEYHKKYIDLGYTPGREAEVFHITCTSDDSDYIGIVSPVLCYSDQINMEKIEDLRILLSLHTSI